MYLYIYYVYKNVYNVSPFVTLHFHIQIKLEIISKNFNK